MSASAGQAAWMETATVCRASRRVDELRLSSHDYPIFYRGGLQSLDRLAAFVRWNPVHGLRGLSQGRGVPEGLVWRPVFK
jgi:hypothetical protein